MAGRSNVYSNLLMRDLRFLQITTLVGETKQNVNVNDTKHSNGCKLVKKHENIEITNVILIYFLLWGM